MTENNSYDVETFIEANNCEQAIHLASEIRKLSLARPRTEDERTPMAFFIDKANLGDASGFDEPLGIVDSIRCSNQRVVIKVTGTTMNVQLKIWKKFCKERLSHAYICCSSYLQERW